MGDEAQVRSATPADAGEILTVQRAAYVTEAQLYSDPFLPMLTQTLDELLLELGCSTTLVAVGGGRIVGTGRARGARGLWRIGRLAVAPDRQGEGIGSRLLAALELAAPPEVREFALFTGERSDQNIALYVRNGYRISHYEDTPLGPRLVHLTKPAPAA